MKKLLIILFFITGVGLALLIDLSEKDGNNRHNKITEITTPTEESIKTSGQVTFIDDFENGLVFEPATAWKAKQLVRGTVELVSDSTNSTNQVAMATAGKISGGEVGKADLIKKYVGIPVGSTIEVKVDFFFPSGSSLDKIHLIDVECDNCGVEKTPGVRLYVRNGKLEIDRGKIGYDDDFKSNASLTTGRWYTIKMDLLIGENSSGKSKVYLDDNLIIDASGTNVISQSVLDQYDLTLGAQHIDSIQVGLTANGNSSDQTLYFDNVSISVIEP